MLGKVSIEVKFQMDLTIMADGTMHGSTDMLSYIQIHTLELLILLYLDVSLRFVLSGFKHEVVSLMAIIYI